MTSDERPAGFAPGSHAIEGYGAGGFLFAGMSHVGSILALPSGVRAWAPTQARDVDPASLDPVFAEPPGAIELLIFGGGPSLTPLPRPARERLREAGVRVELMATGPAAATYNLLREEGRRVAAALIATR